MSGHVDLKAVVDSFDCTADGARAELYGNGHIHATYRVPGGVPQNPDYILQKINTGIFKDVRLLMDNIVLVTSHIRRRTEEDGEPFRHQTMTVVPARDGRWYHEDNQGNAWRMYQFIPDGLTYERATSAEQMFQAGMVIGRFQRLVSDLPAGGLGIVLPRFHSVRHRLERLVAAIAADDFRRKESVKREINALYARAGEALHIEKLEETGDLPRRVTHNDTKLNNVIFNHQGTALGLIDLDTVMPGYSLYDFGDAVRSGCTDTVEDVAEPSTVRLRLDLFEALAHGFLDEAEPILTTTELSALPYSAWLLTYIMAVRFLTDHIEGDRYYKINQPNHNLLRARNQMALMAQMMDQREQMEEIVSSLAK